LLLALALAVFLRARYGGGRPYPDLTTAPLIADDQLERVVTFEQPIGNVAVSAAGRLFFTVHPESRPEGPKLWEWKDGRAVPFPDPALQERLLQTPLGVRIDRRGGEAGGAERLWVIDHGFHGLKTPRLLAFDLATGAVVHDHRFGPGIAPKGSFLQDFQINPKNGRIYIADVDFFAKRPAIVVYDPATGTARRVLERHPSVVPQDWIIRTPVKTMTFVGGLVALKPGVDGIAVTRDGAWVIYGAMTHDTLYRVATADLDNVDLSPEELAARVQAIGRKPLSDGLSTDAAGNALVTDVEHGAVVRIAPDGTLTTLVRTPRVRWADGLSYGPGGWLYLADSDIPDQMLRTKSHIRAAAPYFIDRFRPGIDGTPGQ
jgi:sugar lactone lactonase YvrE